MNKIEEILKNKFENFRYFSFGILDYGLKSDESLKYFNYLISLNDDEIEKELWNSLVGYFDEDDESYFKTMDKSLFCEGGYEFLSKYLNALKYEQSINYLNFNNEYNSDRLLITSGSDKDNDIVYEQLESEGNDVFDLVINTKLPKYSVYLCANTADSFKDNDVKVFFALKLKENNELVGFAQFYQQHCNSCEIGYYIFKKYRKQGYAYEAIKMLIDKIFNNGFVYLIENPEKEHTYIEKFFKPSIITATPNKRNVASTALLEKLGFIKGATLHHRRLDPYTNELLDVEYYYLEKYK